MTTLTRTWTCTLNTVPTQTTLDAQGKSVVRKIKDAYKNAGWSVDGSSDASTAGIDGSDRWSADSKLTWAAAGVAHSWIILKSPTNYPSSGKNIYILIACSTGASSQHLINVTVGSAAFTSGSTTADPTAPANSRAFSNKQVLNSSLTNSKVHTMYNTVGDVICAVSQDSSSLFQHVNWSLQSAPNAESSDTYPYHGMWAYSSTGNGGAQVANTGLTASSVMFWTDGTVVATGNKFGIAQIVQASAGTVLMGSVTSAGSNISGYYPDLPAIVYSNDTSKVAYRGTLVDVSLAPTGTGIVQGTVEPSSGTTTTMIMGEFWVPNGGTTPLL